MSRRRPDTDQEFGSDSFLDIIANIVGILIILIVVAGIKVARQPLTETTTEPAVVSTAHDPIEDDSASDTSEATTDTETPSDDSESDTTELPADVLAAVEAQTEPEVAVEPDLPSQEELDAQIAQLTLHLSDLRSDLQTAAASENELRQQMVLANLADHDPDSLPTVLAQQSIELDRLQQEIATTKVLLASRRKDIDQLAGRQQYVAAALDQIGQETRTLTEVIQEAEQQSDDANRIVHRLSPVGRTVTKEELHFRLSGGRVAYIPLDGLLERMKAQVADRQQIVLRYQRYEGVVGPVGGFNMQYTVQREMMAPLQALQHGRNAFRLSIARWSIQPAETLQAEPVADAVQLGSRFRQIVEAADHDTTVTIWVYGSDFEHFAPLRQLIHRLNLRVAARPLPDGTPIAGSPSGSRSASQ